MKPIKIFELTAGIVITAMIVAAAVNYKNIRGLKRDDLKSDNKGFAVVELFTSEGCSSCPPADELVGRIQKEDQDKPVYILAYHVDYWNRLGWKDVFSNADYSKRQSKYAGWLNLQSVYTPQIVVNGKKEFVGSEEGKLRNAITAGLRMQSSTVLALSALTDPGHALIQYDAKGAEKNTSLLVALIQKSAQTKVKSGENGGHTLSHVQIVRKVQSLPLTGNASGKTTIALPDGFTAQGWEVIGFVQNDANGEILAAAKIDFNTAK
ncbi:DUF1223 domain-containing protein [Mucilaginibacter aquaedulcis]|uniref:DUF1223 domain-containing protein n=1 Tax=Mucilaginibacter aquaedulcis TaxID=1187081 RepID=UPI0025B483BF|nr:DUF1223 domain-containing protein [Mucilaginibacter aquaedulcis]MDN3550888.1 DUF1223 domain-containing protein [Mucilaginibacter aquaedulcis]